MHAFASPSPAPCSLPTGNVTPILNEVVHALSRLIDTGQSTIIDLRAIPLAPGEETRVENTLGSGEAQARIEALGTSEFRETRFSGVWLVTHYNTEQEILGKFIEITKIPALLMSQEEDMIAGIAAIRELINH